MLKRIISFSGRITRTEYTISIMMYTASFVAINIMSLRGMAHYRHTEYIMMAHLPLFWFLLAQGAKRCHDINKPAWWQLVPFYGLWLLLQDGQPYQNKYGDDPKRRY
ncbi:DUF805 domain-containing protein [Mucilaginibacter sp. CSA2-8R]|uniref:DUF805 domain-containing protein n=1 Tax=Mucilaginibacter sp. CSA2-8R TaxID=3141542 RepID=UPI00315C75B2